MRWKYTGITQTQIDAMIEGVKPPVLEEFAQDARFAIESVNDLREGTLILEEPKETTLVDCIELEAVCLLKSVLEKQKEIA